MDLKNNIREFIKSNLVLTDDEAFDFNDRDDIFRMGFVNSLFAMKLLNFVENEYQIIIDNDDINIDNFSSVEKIATLINKSKKVNE